MKWESRHTCFYDVAPDPTLACAKARAEAIDLEPDVIIALGGGSAMDAGKIMWGNVLNIRKQFP